MPQRFGQHPMLVARRYGRLNSEWTIVGLTSRDWYALGSLLLCVSTRDMSKPPSEATALHEAHQVGLTLYNPSELRWEKG